MRDQSDVADLAGKRVVLVGGAGFIGHHLAVNFKRRGADVVIVDSLQVNNLLSLYDDSAAPRERAIYSQMINDRLELLSSAEVPLYVDDARDYHRLGKHFSEFKANVVILLSAVSHASRANKDPRTTLDHSFRTLENALDLSRGLHAHFIFFSSSMVYGNFSKPAVDESEPCDPVAIYGAVKLGGEQLVRAYGRVFGVPFTIVRPSALYGERCISRRVGQVFIENAIRGQDLIVMGDGNDLVDFTYIDDLVSGVGLVVREPAARGHVFNITFGQARSLLDVAEIVKGRYPGVDIRFEPRDSLVPERGTLQVFKARELLGYEPLHPVEEGFARYMDWYGELFERVGPNALADLEAQRNE